MSFSDSDWTAEAAAAPAGRREGAGDRVGVLVLGMAIGAVVASLVFFALDRLPRRDAGKDVAVAHRNVPAAGPPAAHDAPALIDTHPPAAGSAPSAPTASDAAEAEDADASSPASAPVPATVVSADEKRRRERAWARFYRRPASCDGNPTTDQLIECANHFIRSKREFDERWKAGTL